VALHKKMLRILSREILVHLEEDAQDLPCIIPWHGGCHPTWAMAKPLAGAVT
jgi:hypothetical protein